MLPITVGNCYRRSLIDAQTKMQNPPLLIRLLPNRRVNGQAKSDWRGQGIGCLRNFPLDARPCPFTRGGMGRVQPVVGACRGLGEKKNLM